VTVLGMLLAAGAGRRMGTPKALLRDRHGAPFLARAIGVLLDGGCDSVLVVSGAAAEEVTGILDETGWRENPVLDVVVAGDWNEGMGASLRAGLAAARATDASCALVTLVDLPDVGAPVVRRMLDALTDDRTALGRASYDGVPGHPVLLGREHWAGVIETAYGDRGARDYLAANPPKLVECGDLATGRDVDRPADL
jgi:CTP:molybdopterin cytidylyltransferase MocA